MSYNKYLSCITVMVNVSINEEELKENNLYFENISRIQINIDIFRNYKHSHKESLNQLNRRRMYIKKSK